MKEQGTSICETVAIFKISTQFLPVCWKNQWETSGIDDLKLKKKGSLAMKKMIIKENSIEALQAKNQYLK